MTASLEFANRFVSNAIALPAKRGRNSEAALYFPLRALRAA